MRRGFILFVGILALALVPAMACAQNSGAFGLSGLPSMPSLSGGSNNCGNTKGFGFAPEVYFGWGIPQNRNTSVSLTAQDQGADSIQNVNLNLPTRGFWLGVALPVGLTDNLSFVATGWYLTAGYMNLNTNTNTSEENLVVNNGGGNTALPPLFGVDWGAKPYWWFADGALAYTFGGSGCGGPASSGFSLLLGARYDYYFVAVNNPNGTNFQNSLFTNQDEGDVTSRAVIPFVGFQTAFKDSVQNLSVRFLGAPVLGNCNVGLTTMVGRFQYEDVTYNAGYFCEIFGEYSRKFFGSSQAGVFARWNTTSARSSGTGAINNSGGGLQVTNWGNQDNYSLSLWRNSWTLGGLVTLDFTTPF
jgi:hypothetical protein